jgi:hypothetical protein
MATKHIPLGVKLLQTGFVCVLVPTYWVQYGPSNFLWISDIALIVIVVALWTNSSLLASMEAVAVVALEFGWIVDFLVRLLTGAHLIGLSDYMFDTTIPLWIRGLSLFHVWMPFLLLWMVYCFGYDRRAWLAQSIAAAIILPLSYLLSEPAKNVNWVYGFGDQPQTWLPPWLFVVLLIVAYPICLYLPTHLLLQKIMPPVLAHSQ